MSEKHGAILNIQKPSEKTILCLDYMAHDESFKVYESTIDHFRKQVLRFDMVLGFEGLTITEMIMQDHHSRMKKEDINERAAEATQILCFCKIMEFLRELVLEKYTEDEFVKRHELTIDIHKKATDIDIASELLMKADDGKLAEVARAAITKVNLYKQHVLENVKSIEDGDANFQKIVTDVTLEFADYVMQRRIKAVMNYCKSAGIKVMDLRTKKRYNQYKGE